MTSIPPQSPKQRFEAAAFPEARFGGFTRHDGTIAFYTRLSAIVEPGHVLLDLGCGRGRHQEDKVPYRRDIRDFRHRAAKVIGLDVDEAGFSNPFLHEFRLLTDPGHWPVEDGSVDVIACDYVLEHIDNPKRFFAEVARVLRPGGYFCARTPNLYSYFAVIAQLVPNRFHGKVTRFAQGGRKDIDVFPTRYRCNTKRSLRRLLGEVGFEVAVYGHESPPGYLFFSWWVYRLGIVLHNLTPEPLRSTLFIFARKRDAAPPSAPPGDDAA